MVCTYVIVVGDTILIPVERAQPDKQILQKKGCGCIIHVSDFVEEENGHLIVGNERGVIIKDAQTIIYPGTGSDPWWDHTQLLVQVDKAITIFNKAHLGCEGVFIFNQSSAHGLLRLDALCAFNMNKSNGGKQRKQKDTVIPMNNLHEGLCRKPQKMTMDTSDTKGLKQVLEECRFNIAGMSAKCFPVCAFENNNCCMACLLSKQDDFHLQTSLLEQKSQQRVTIVFSSQSSIAS